MSRFKSYSPDQSYLLPPSVQDELSGDPLCFFFRRVVERLDLSAFEQSYAAEGGSLLYAPELMLGVWLYAYATGITSARQLERRLLEELSLRYLAAGARVDNWALSAFRRRHARALNDCFTQVLDARELGMGRLGKVAIDSTRIKHAHQARASRPRPAATSWTPSSTCAICVPTCAVRCAAGSRCWTPTMRTSARTDPGRQRLLLHREPGTDGSANTRCLCARLEPRA